MLSSKRFSLWYFAIVILFTNTLSSFTYQYPPIKRGSEEWKRLSPAEKHTICQIPDQILAEMSTEDLIQAYLDYPFIALIAAYNNWQIGFRRVYRDFNVLRELLIRKDAGRKIIQYYKKMDPEAYNKDWAPYERGRFAVNFAYIEILIAQESVLQQLNSQETREYLLEGINKYNLKKKHVELHGVCGLEFTTFPLARLIRLKSSVIAQELLQVPNMEYFLNTAKAKNYNILRKIIQSVIDYINQ